jgi:hypothetical protein
MKRFLKHALAGILSLVVAFACLGVGFGAESVVATGSCGGGATWELSQSGTLRVKGSGAMTNYYTGTPGYYRYRTEIKTVTVDSGITGIGAYSFYDLPNLTSATLPDSVTAIGDCAFEECRSLTSVNLPSHLTTIGSEAFYLCKGLTSVIVPGTVENLGSYAFFGCAALSSVTLGEGVKSLGDYSFFYCNSLTSITLPDSLTTIGIHAFEHAGLSSISIPSSVTSIGAYALGYVYNESENDEVPVAGFQILGYSGTEAERYATDNGFTFGCGHSWGGGQVLREATEEQTGLVSYVCSLCGAEKTEEVPALGTSVQSQSAEPDTPVTQAVEEITFSDVMEGQWYSDAVDWAVENGITNGVSEGEFAPGKTCTRAEIVTFLWKEAGKPAPTTSCQFSDVAAGSWYAEAVSWAVENGITNGTSDTTFSPNAVCTRAQIVRFLWNKENEPQAAATCAFDDVKSGSWYEEAVSWAVENGITNGTSATDFSPNGQCTRAQAVTFLYREDGE